MAEFHVFADVEAQSRAAASLIVGLSHRALEARGRFTLALSGGSGPVRLMELLAGEPCRGSIPWDRTLIFWGDDRAVGPEHELSNFRLARERLLSRVPVPEANLVRIRGELGAVDAALELRLDLAECFGESAPPRFDLVLLGMGLDGHTASLFPGRPELDSAAWAEPVPAPDMEPRVERVTMTLPVLGAARTALFLVAGQDKRALVDQIRHDPTAPARYPAARVAAEQTLWYLDEAAAGPGRSD
ncbi:MAG: 6-phosphogluconolactonase [Pseudodesulfovibrio sp.]|uniref:6-phosphogluconolactonase n=1 Tax=Pseudodesulfovibrio aespoeensis (strain ATCC 700646 / DSM 10631 / Aspo-2) TaxID=643562 RepID=E6VY95_PSEA9|nr:MULTISPECIES: 6-phosphogluconolactonase [Pseudodesulfovibrio]MBU4192000.1 6-phosphogluconolactonase [Pseudomonadota bacterium]ADU61553.1 6-phosphogluconolactonase [Pseudodesulfovibrio aespoeensis Aspo-2]MBU4243104.1 6-phosphogluconolactonase [Pseudomonadota bacterium]MBU4377483.1 6-phosphogluconolactonase [Pseudomonadota bacterium]MBU4474626.1 6-phosphogluconolactonase [Pseudomonadota bacterium]